MKKILFAIAIVLTIGLTANAQNRNDAFVAEWSSNGGDAWRDALAITLPSGGLGTIEGDPGAPLGSGLLVLTALGAGYAVARKRKK